MSSWTLFFVSFSRFNGIPRRAINFRVIFKYHLSPCQKFPPVLCPNHNFCPGILLSHCFGDFLKLPNLPFWKKHDKNNLKIRDKFLRMEFMISDFINLFSELLIFSYFKYIQATG